jgi:hypothetical protein
MRYNTAKHRVLSSEEEIDEHARLISLILDLRSWMDYLSCDLRAKMRCK